MQLIVSEDMAKIIKRSYGGSEPVKRSGTADLPLHGGHVPAWLASRMTELGAAIAESILIEYGPPDLQRLFRVG